MSTVSDAWSRIHGWLEQHAPKILGNLNPPASDSEINAAEKALGCRMPAEWREIYAAHNGMNDTGNFGSLFFGMNFLILDAVLREHANNDVEAEPLSVRSADPGINCDNMHNLKWVALAHDFGDTLLRVDMDPDSKGQIGQVIFTDHAFDTSILLAPSVGRFLSDFADDLEQGRYFLDPEALNDDNQFLACMAENDIINWHRSPRWAHLNRK